MNILARSPFWINDFFPVEPTTALSAKLELTIAGSLRYTIIKNESISVGFEVSELIRDYINWVYNNANAHFVTVSYEINWYSGLDGTGSIEATTTSSTLYATEGYGYFLEGRNPTHTRGYLQSNYIIYKPKDAQLRIPIDENNTSLVFFNGVDYAGGIAPIGTNAVDYVVSYSIQSVSYDSFEDRVLRDAGVYEGGSCFPCAIVSPDLASVTQVDVYSTDGNQRIEVRTMDDSRYQPLKLTFINRWGAEQDVWFFKKSVESIRTKKETFNSFDVTATGIYDTTEHNIKVFNVESERKMKLNTGYVDESYNVVMKELMQSERVWLSMNSETYPVNVDTNSLTFKTSLNDRLVDYSIDISFAYNEINNVR